MGPRIRVGCWLLGVAAGLACQLRAETVTFLIARGEVEELRMVVGDKVHRRHPLGFNTVFGVSADKLVTISQREEAGRAVQRLTVFDLHTGSVLSERPVEARLMTWLSGPERVVLVPPKEDAAYFAVLEVSGDSVATALARFDLRTGKVGTFRIPEEVPNPRPFEVAGGVGVYSWNHGAMALLDGVFRTIVTKVERPSTLVDPSARNACLSLPGVGVLRVTFSGKLELFDPAPVEGASPRVLSLGTGVVGPEAATFDGKPVLVFGEAVRGAMGRAAVSALVVYDPIAGKPLWRKTLPWLARAFTVSRDASLFRLMPLTSLELTYYDRKSDSFTKSIALKPREAESVVIVPSD